MAIQVQNITDEAYQRHTIVLDGYAIVLKLRFCERVQGWFMDIEHPDWTMNGILVTIGVRMLKSAARTIDFICRDRSGNGVDPFRLDDFSTNRCGLYLLDESDVLKLSLGEPLT